MRSCSWRGVFPALTTQFHADESLDIDATIQHLEILIGAGIHGVILLGSVGENTALDPSEKRLFLREHFVDVTPEMFQQLAEEPTIAAIKESSGDPRRITDLGEWEAARALYRWYTPLLHLDTHPKPVQYIKLCMAEAGFGSETARAPRLAIEGREREQILAVVPHALATRPPMPAVAAL